MAGAILILTIVLGIALGTFSTIFFFWTWIAGQPPAWAVWAQILVSVGFSSAIAGSALPMRVKWTSSRTALVPILVLSGIAGTAIVLLAIYCLNQPHGEWDAWAIWNLHARFLFRGGEHWRDMFTGELFWSHTDYPFLLPAVLAGGWTLAGEETTTVPMFFTFLFTIATIGLVIAAACVMRRDWRGLAAGVVLVAAPDILFHGAYQAADVPLAFYFLLTMVLVQLSDRFNRNRMLFLAGMSAAFAAWMKNEGLLFLLVLGAAWVLSVLFTGKREHYGKSVLSLVAGAAPIILMILVLKFWVVPRNDLLTQPGTMPAKLLDVSRYGTIAASFGRELAAFGGGPVNSLYALGALLAFVGIDARRGKLRTGQLCTVLVAVLMFAGYFMVYVVTPQDLQWHLDSSLERLYVELWPIAVLAAACAGIPRSDELQGSAAAERVRGPHWLNAASVALVLIGIVLPAAIALSPDQASSEPVVAAVGTTEASSASVENNAGLLAVTIRDQRPLVTGFAELQNSAGMAILGYRADGVSGGDAVLSSTMPVRSGSFPFKTGGSYKTSVAITNTENTEARITISNTGESPRTFSLPANEQISGFINGPPFGVRTRAGTVNIQSSAALLISAFLTIDPFGPGFLIAGLPAGSAEIPASPYLQIPYVLWGNGWVAELNLVNPSSGTLSGRLRLLDRAGETLNEQTYEIRPEQSAGVRFPDGGSHIEIVADGSAAPAAAAIFYRERDGITNLTGISAVSQDVNHTLFAEWSLQTETEIKIVNNGLKPASVEIGLATKVSKHKIEPKTAITIPLNNLAGFQLLSLPVRELVTIKSNEPVTAAALRWVHLDGQRQLTTAYGSLTRGRFFPYFASGSGFHTDFVMSGAGTLGFLDHLGKPFALSFLRH